VIGTGSDWQVSGTLVVGNASEGVLSIANGGLVTATALDTAALGNATANIQVSGTHSTLGVTTNVTLGDNAGADMSVLSGASVTVGGDMHLGLQANGSGFLTVSDSGVLSAARCISATTPAPAS
jgi:hypothetical protein